MDANELLRMASELYRYDPETGLFTHAKDKRAGRGMVIAKAGDVAGSLDQKGYVKFKIAGKNIKAHRLAWLLMTGDLPKGEIDHINGIKGDNRWVNLRDVSPSVNRQNIRKARADSATGVLGVSPYRKNRYQATISVNGRSVRLGEFYSKEEASAAYWKAKQKYHAEAVAR